MDKLEWYCPSCKERGVVPYLCGDCIMSVSSRVNQAHVLASPLCNQAHTRIQLNWPDDSPRDSSRELSRVVFGRTDIEAEAGRRLSDSEIQRIQETNEWRQLTSMLVEHGYSIIGRAMEEAGINPETEEDDEVSGTRV